MAEIVKVRLKKVGRVFSFLARGVELSRGDPCIVKTDRGLEFGEVVAPPEPCPQPIEARFPMKVVRKASPKDVNSYAQVLEKEKEAFETCAKKIAARELPMKLVNVEATFDKKKLIFYFVAENRIDFRELVKELAVEFKTRIELRQIGVRDQARMIGGLGPCGRPLCCATFLKSFEPVSIKKAKKQKLALNPAKISGLCGRLMCCILYEDELYSENEKGPGGACGKCDRD
jgi:cell fate regulator YaaT (PSP1 superfamily)